jgi:hypothetical protein
MADRKDPDASRLEMEDQLIAADHPRGTAPAPCSPGTSGPAGNHLVALWCGRPQARPRPQICLAMQHNSGWLVLHRCPQSVSQGHRRRIDQNIGVRRRT